MMQRLAQVHQRQLILVFGRPFVKRFAVCYRSVVCLSCLSCLSVTLVYCGQTVGWIKMKLGAQIGLGSGHIVLDGDPAPPSPKGHSPHPIFGSYLLRPNGCVDQDATGMELGLGPGDIVLDGDLAPPSQKVVETLPPNFRPMFIVAKRLDGSRWYLAWT